MTRRLAWRRPRAFTLIEVMLAAALLSLLALLVSGAWVGLGRSLADSIVRCRIAQEASLTLESLDRDLSGALPELVTGERRAGRMVGRLSVANSELMLCFDGEPLNDIADWAAPDTTVVYQLQGDQLVRTDQATGTAFIVASHVDEILVADQTDGVRIDVTFSFRNITRTYTIISRDP